MYRGNNEEPKYAVRALWISMIELLLCWSILFVFTPVSSGERHSILGTPGPAGHERMPINLRLAAWVFFIGQFLSIAFAITALIRREPVVYTLWAFVFFALDLFLCGVFMRL
jgi:hypothetical protein